MPSCPVHAFLCTHGQMTDLGALGGSESIAYDVNPTLDVVGLAATASGQRHAFLYSGGSMQDLGTLGGTLSVAFAINHAGGLAEARLLQMRSRFTPSRMTGRLSDPARSAVTTASHVTPTSAGRSLVSRTRLRSAHLTRFSTSEG